jgi:ubiquinol-cytochrome c reductase cytochrome c subunit
MSNTCRGLLGLFALALPLILAGCPGDFSGGYDKVALRERTPLALAAAPDPPPVVAGIGGPAAVETPMLAPEATPPGVTQAMVEEGQQLYGTVCTACHGPGGAGTPAGPGLRDQDWIHITGAYDEIVNIIQVGVPNTVQYPGMMPPLGGGNFDAEQIRAIAAYILALSTQPGA